MDMGAEAIKERYLKKNDLNKLSAELGDEMRKTASEAKKRSWPKGLR